MGIKQKKNNIQIHGCANANMWLSTVLLVIIRALQGSVLGPLLFRHEILNMIHALRIYSMLTTHSKLVSIESDLEHSLTLMYLFLFFYLLQQERSLACAVQEAGSERPR